MLIGTMRPSVIALGMALLLFILVKAISPPVLYLALLVPVAFLVYGLIAEEIPDTPFGDEEDHQGRDTEDVEGGLSGDTGSSKK